MKRIDTYITEKLHINTATKIEYMYHPKDKNELIECIKNKISIQYQLTKRNPLNLNDIDTSKITDMSYLFNAHKGDLIVGGDLIKLSKNGHFDVSDWDVSNVTNMECMFYCSAFNGNISDWDVSSVENMQMMFSGSKFTGENGDLSKWNVSKVENMYGMFAWSKFTNKNGDISDWNVSSVDNMKDIFYECPLESNPPKWYVNKSKGVT